MPRTTPSTTRALLLLAATAFALTRLSRPTRTGVRLYVERLQRVAPIQQFAPAGNRGVLGRDTAPFTIRIVAHHDAALGRTVLIPVDERVLAGWLS